MPTNYFSDVGRVLAVTDDGAWTTGVITADDSAWTTGVITGNTVWSPALNTEDFLTYRISARDDGALYAHVDLSEPKEAEPLEPCTEDELHEFLGV